MRVKSTTEGALLGNGYFPEQLRKVSSGDLHELWLNKRRSRKAEDIAKLSPQGVPQILQPVRFADKKVIPIFVSALTIYRLDTSNH
ncbi:MAG: hypothetical protein HOO91_17250 [Bacteroidales bacterium]|nr:hypothetical protein [Bacteroidales bacterium]